MVSNHNTSRPPHWPSGALRASVGEVPTQPQTASGEAPPAAWSSTAGWNHYYPQGAYLSGCRRFHRSPETIPPDLNLLDCAKCFRVAKSTGGKK